MRSRMYLKKRHTMSIQLQIQGSKLIKDSLMQESIDQFKSYTAENYYERLISLINKRSISFCLFYKINRTS